jgi:hypothetical protein
VRIEETQETLEDDNNENSDPNALMVNRDLDSNQKFQLAPLNLKHRSMMSLG